MFSFIKKWSSPAENFSKIKVDMHSHLIPGIDDGAKTIEKSVEYIQKLADLGFQKIITTPHIMGEYYPNTPEIILGGLEKVRTAIAKEGIKIDLDAAAEYYIDDYFIELLNEEKPLLTLPGNRLLIEFSTFAPPSNFSEILFRLKTKGYQPILAHPERYVYYSDQLEKFQDLKAKGCALQVNILSVIGHYGEMQKKIARYLFKKQLVDYIGTDLHHGGHVKLLDKSLKNRQLQKILKEYSFSNNNL